MAIQTGEKQCGTDQHRLPVGVVNPYHVKGPLRPDDLTYISREDKVIPDALEDVTHGPQTGIVVIKGLRYTGKRTELLNWERHNHDDERSLIVPCNALVFEGQTYKNGGKIDYVLGVLASQVEAMCELHGYRVDSKKKDNTFYDRIHNVCKMTGRRVVLRIDYAEALVQDCVFGPRGMDEFVEKISEVVYSNETDSNGLSVVLTTGEWNDTTWIDTLQSGAPENRIEVLRQRLFNIKETAMLANLPRACINYDNSAIDALFRATGGHPALTQLVAHNVILGIREKGLDPDGLIIDGSDVNDAVGKVLKDTQYSGILQYMVRHSIPKEGRNLLKEIVLAQENRGPGELAITDKNYILRPFTDQEEEVARRLVEMQILTSYSGDRDYRIRIGMWYEYLRQLYRAHRYWDAL